MNETIETIRTRRTAHLYRPDPVPEQVIAAALECAIRAPNHKLTNPWRFTRVGEASRARIVDLGVRIKQEKGPMSERQVAKARAKLSSAPELFVVRQVISDDDFRRREDYAACACAIQNFCLALWSEGIHSKWSSGGVTFHPETYTICEVDPELEEIIGFVWVGYATEQPGTPRLAVDQVLSTIP